MKKIWIVNWFWKYAETKVFNSAAEAYNHVFDRISEYSDFDELRKELAESYDVDEEDFGIEEVVEAYVERIHD